MQNSDHHLLVNGNQALINGKSYSLLGVKLVAVNPVYKYLYTKYKGYGVYLRRERGADFLGTFGNKAEADQIAQVIATAIASNMSAVTSDDPIQDKDVSLKGSCSDIILAGNTVVIEGDQLISGGRTFSLEYAHRASRSSQIPDGYIILQGLAVAVALILFVGIVGLGFLIGIYNPTVLTFSIPIALIIVMGWFLVSFVYLTSKLPSVFLIMLYKPSGTLCVYMSENMNQVDTIINQINSIKGTARGDKFKTYTAETEGKEDSKLKM